MDEFIIVGLLGPLYEGPRFSKWPRHLTVVPWFDIDGGTRVALAVMHKVAALIPRFNMSVGETALFGPHQNVPVHVIEPSEQLQLLHQFLIGELENAGGVVQATYYIESSYRPHITVQKGDKFPVQTGDTLTFDKLYLVKANRGKDRRTRPRFLVGEVELRDAAKT